MRRVSILGILIGAVIDIVTSIALELPFGFYALSKIDLTHTPKDQVQHALAAVMHSNLALYLCQLFVGFACSVLGGFIAAMIARRAELLNGTLSSFLCVFMGIYAMTVGKNLESIPVQILLLIASPLMGLLGGELQLRQVRHNAQAKI